MEISKPLFIFSKMIFEKYILFRNTRRSSHYTFKSAFDYDEHFHHITIDDEKFLINAVHLKAQQPKGLVFFLHGTLKDIQYHIPLCYEFLENNYDVYMLDYPNYGKSKGKLHESYLYHIAQRVYQECIENDYSKKINYSKKIIVGRSLGTAIASNLAIHSHADNLILITPYYNMPDLISHILRRKKPLHLKNHFPNHKFVPEISIPITIFHGTNDKLIPHFIAEKLKQHLKQVDTFVTLPGANHFNVHLHTEYKNQIKNILQ